MTLNRYAAKVDSSQRTLVKELRAVGIEVWIIRKPCDLLLRFWCNRHQGFCWQTLEAKSPYGKKEPKARIRGDQAAQAEFLRETDTPIATTFEEALRRLNMRHGLGTVRIPDPLHSVAVG